MAADGGVYAELIKNRSFEFNTLLSGCAEHKKEGVDVDIPSYLTMLFRAN